MNRKIKKNEGTVESLAVFNSTLNLMKGCQCRVNKTCRASLYDG